MTTPLNADADDAALLAMLANDPNAVHISLLSGSLARPTPTQIVHIYGEEALRSVMALSTGEAGVGVKPLSWGRDHIRNEWHGNVEPGTGYNYLVKDDGRWCYGPERRWVLDQAGDVEAAKVACQADRDARIRSQIMLSSAPPVPAQTSERDDPLPDDLRAQGFAVAVHNDYRLNGVPMTFWLLTHPDGRYVKGEGKTDAEALNAIRALKHTTPEPIDGQ
jgi:hypothetical protein